MYEVVSEVRAESATFDDGLLRIVPGSRDYIEVQEIQAEKTRAAVRAPGQVVFREGAVAEVGVPIAGRVAQVHVKVGDLVREGDPLVTLVSPDAAAIRAELSRAQTKLEAARNEYERQMTIVEKGVGVERDRFESKMRLAEAEVVLASAERAVAFLGEGTGTNVVVRSPIDGTVLLRRVTVGASLDNGSEPPVTIGDPAALWVVVDVFVDDLPLVEPGSPATVQLASFAQPIGGEVVSIGAVLDRQLRRAPVYIALDEGSASGVSLRHGMYARAQINSDVLDGVMVPASAVAIKDGRRYVVYVEDGVDGLAFRQQEVVVGQVIDDHVQVIRGLSAGERIVVRGALLLDGTADLLQ